MVEIRAIISGDVQGVAYRAYAQDSATALGLVGLVRNLTNGTVEVIAQGEPDVLKDFVEYLHEGSSLSAVSTVAVDWRTPAVTYNEFSVLQ